MGEFHSNFDRVRRADLELSASPGWRAESNEAGTVDMLIRPLPGIDGNQAAELATEVTTQIEDSGLMAVHGTYSLPEKDPELVWAIYVTSATTLHAEDTAVTLEVETLIQQKLAQ